MARLPSLAEAWQTAAGLPVFWDGYGLEHRESGVFTYAYSLASELLKLSDAAAPSAAAPSDRVGVRPVMVAPPGAARHFAALPSLGVYELPDPALASRFGRLKPIWPTRVGAAVHKAGKAPQTPYIIHGLSNFNIPLTRARPSLRRVLTVHDLIPLLATGGVSTALRYQMQLLMPRAISAADRIICVSQWTYNTLLSRYPSAAPKSVVIPNGFPALALGRGTLDNRNLLGRGACPSKSEPWRLSRHGEGSREGTAPRLVVTGASNPPIKLLYISRFEPYKHHTLLFSLLRASPALSLTLVTDPSGAQTLKTLAPDLLATHRLSITSSLLPAALTTLHKDTDIYISPSSLEGFSLPVADALAAGKPVVYQSGSGIDEVAGATVAWPVAPDAPVDAWLAAIASASAAASTPAFAAAAHAYVSSRPTWKDAAIALINLYGALK